MTRKYRPGEDPMADIYMSLQHEVPFTEHEEVAAFQHRDTCRNAYYRTLLSIPNFQSKLIPALQDIAAGQKKPQPYLLGMQLSPEQNKTHLAELRGNLETIEAAPADQIADTLAETRLKQRAMERIYHTLRNGDISDENREVLDRQREALQAAISEIASRNRKLIFKTVHKRASSKNPHRFAALYSQVSSSSYLRAIEGFKVDEGNKFSTYATWAMNNELNRLWQLEKRHRRHFKESSQGKYIQKAYFNAAVPGKSKYALTSEYSFDELVLRACLDDREAEILRGRFGLEGPEQTQVELGARYRITKERIKQIEQRALQKLRWVA